MLDPQPRDVSHCPGVELHDTGVLGRTRFVLNDPFWISVLGPMRRHPLSFVHSRWRCLVAKGGEIQISFPYMVSMYPKVKIIRIRDFFLRPLDCQVAVSHETKPMSKAPVSKMPFFLSEPKSSP